MARSSVSAGPGAQAWHSAGWGWHGALQKGLVLLFGLPVCSRLFEPSLLLTLLITYHVTLWKLSELKVGPHLLEVFALLSNRWLWAGR